MSCPARRSAIVVVLLILAAGVASLMWWQGLSEAKEPADPRNPEQVALGRIVYAEHCASCHGAKLEGQPNWRTRMANGRLPAPPHDATGHTWEHTDEALFAIIKQGAQAFVSPDYQTDMGGFGHVLNDDEIWAVIAFIESTWPKDFQNRRRPDTSQ